jgi:hypothetical protein
LLLSCVLLYAENVVEVGGHTGSGGRAEWASEEHEGTGWESARANVFAGFIYSMRVELIQITRAKIASITWRGVVPTRARNSDRFHDAGGRGQCFCSHFHFTIGCFWLRPVSRHPDRRVPRFFQANNRSQKLHCADIHKRRPGWPHPCRTARQVPPKCLQFPKSASSCPGPRVHLISYVPGIKDQVSLKIILPERLSCIAVDRRGQFCAAGTAQGRIYLWEVCFHPFLGINAHIFKFHLCHRLPQESCTTLGKLIIDKSRY